MVSHAVSTPFRQSASQVCYSEYKETCHEIESRFSNLSEQNVGRSYLTKVSIAKHWIRHTSSSLPLDYAMGEVALVKPESMAWLPETDF